MFTAVSRERLNEQLIAEARMEDRVVAAALLGSSSAGAEDEWSDIDLALLALWRLYGRDRILRDAWQGGTWRSLPDRPAGISAGPPTPSGCPCRR